MQTATLAAKAARPLLNSQIEDLRGLLLLTTENGGPAELSRAPVSLLKRGLVFVAAKAEGALKPGRTGWKGNRARYALTPAGMKIAIDAQRVRDELTAIRRANRGSNAVIG